MQESTIHIARKAYGVEKEVYEEWVRLSNQAAIFEGRLNLVVTEIQNTLLAAEQNYPGKEGPF